MHYDYLIEGTFTSSVHLSAISSWGTFATGRGRSLRSRSRSATIAFVLIEFVFLLVHVKVDVLFEVVVLFEADFERVLLGQGHGAHLLRLVALTTLTTAVRVALPALVVAMALTNLATNVDGIAEIAATRALANVEFGFVARGRDGVRAGGRSRVGVTTLN